MVWHAFILQPASSENTQDSSQAGQRPLNLKFPWKVIVSHAQGIYLVTALLGQHKPSIQTPSFHHSVQPLVLPIN